VGGGMGKRGRFAVGRPIRELREAMRQRASIREYH
jgi:hypothetical protein